MDPSWDRLSARKVLRVSARFTARWADRSLPLAAAGDRARWLKDESVWEVTGVEGGLVTARVLVPGGASRPGDEATVTEREWLAMLWSGALCEPRPLPGEPWAYRSGALFTVVWSWATPEGGQAAFEGADGGRVEVELSPDQMPADWGWDRVREVP